MKGHNEKVEATITLWVDLNTLDPGSPQTWADIYIGEFQFSSDDEIEGGEDAYLSQDHLISK